MTSDERLPRGLDLAAFLTDVTTLLLADCARRLYHDRGLPWTDPRSGLTYPPPVAPGGGTKGRKR